MKGSEQYPVSMCTIQKKRIHQRNGSSSGTVRGIKRAAFGGYERDETTFHTSPLCIQAATTDIITIILYLLMLYVRDASNVYIRNFQTTNARSSAVFYQADSLIASPFN
jgi:hypothetical protein